MQNFVKLDKLKIMVDVFSWGDSNTLIRLCTHGTVLDFLRSMPFYIDDPFLNPEAVWKEIKLIGDNVSLYPAGFDVERIRDALRNTKLLHASKVKKATTYKWKLILEGNQAVLFKPRIK